MSRSVSIHSDGTARGTVVLTDDGEVVEGVTSLTYSMSALDGIPDVTIEVRGKTSVNASGEVQEVTFVCQLCESTTEHRCDTTFGSQPDNNFRLVSNMQTMSIFDFEICGQTFTDSAGKTLMCYVNKDVWHHAHVDVKTGQHWQTR